MSLTVRLSNCKTKDGGELFLFHFDQRSLSFIAFSLPSNPTLYFYFSLGF